MGEMKVPERPWTLSGDELLDRLAVSAGEGLDPPTVRERRKRFGSNRLREVKARSAWLILSDQLKSLMILLLGIATVVSLAFADWLGGMSIGFLIMVNAGIGFFTELKATRSMEALRRLSRVSAKVRRGKTLREIAASELVLGDIVILEAGDLVPADLRLIAASKLQADESALTGESVPVGKGTEPVGAGADLADRTNMLFKGTSLTRGSAEGLVTAVGMHTELGKISAMVATADEEQTPLEQRLNQLSQRIMWLTLAVGGLVVVFGTSTGKELSLMIETGIALAVATIPEGLPIVATVALARGMLRMAKRNALVNRLSAVETLGATGVICTDKTGTLTENRMTAVQFLLDSGEIDVGGGALDEQGKFTQNGAEIDPSGKSILQEALKIGALCNNASLEKKGQGERTMVGDPTEVALLVAAGKAGIDRDDLAKRHPEDREEAFDPQVMMMATFNRKDDGYLVSVKGALEAVLPVSSHLLTEENRKELQDEDRRYWMARNQEMAERGLRVLSLATKNVDQVGADPYEKLTLVGLVGLMDPPRREVKEAISACHDAGIKVVMVTGDQPATARHVARALDLVEEDSAEVLSGRDLKSPDALSEEEAERILGARIFARVSPKEKLDLIAIHQKKGGAVVGMTGDGVNDAPALKKADIGIAMGRRGTQVAREAADIVLKDDAFSTIVAAVAQGRAIFDNIRKFVLYLLPCNVGEVLAVGLASLFGAPLPILPLQILFLNVVADAFPALALAMGEGDPSVMKEPPRDPQEPVITTGHWLAIGGYGVVFSLTILGAFAIALVWLELDNDRAITVSFLALSFGHLWHIFNLRKPGSRLFRNEITGNSYVWGALVLSALLLAGVVYTPVVSAALRLSDPGVSGWIVIGVMSLGPLVIGQLLKGRSRG